jgi:hypothetical protein
MATEKVHVIPAKDAKHGWIVREAGKEGVTQHYDTKEGALEAARILAEGNSFDIEIHPDVQLSGGPSND